MATYLRRALQDPISTTEWLGNNETFTNSTGWSSDPFNNSTNWSSDDSDDGTMDSKTFIIVLLSIILFLIVMSGTKWFGHIACCNPQVTAQSNQNPIRHDRNFKLTASQKRAGLELLFFKNKVCYFFINVLTFYFCAFMSTHLFIFFPNP